MSHIPDRDRGFVSIGALAADCLARIGQHRGRVDRPWPVPDPRRLAGQLDLFPATPVEGQAARAPTPALAPSASRGQRRRRLA